MGWRTICQLVKPIGSVWGLSCVLIPDLWSKIMKNCNKCIWEPSNGSSGFTKTQQEGYRMVESSLRTAKHSQLPVWSEGLGISDPSSHLASASHKISQTNLVNCCSKSIENSFIVCEKLNTSRHCGLRLMCLLIICVGHSCIWKNVRGPYERSI